jgi:hypothetical protein
MKTIFEIVTYATLHTLAAICATGYKLAILLDLSPYTAPETAK